MDPFSLKIAALVDENRQLRARVQMLEEYVTKLGGTLPDRRDRRERVPRADIGSTVTLISMLNNREQKPGHAYNLPGSDEGSYKVG